MAAQNVKQCKLEHDQCRDIDGNDNVGQNLYYGAKTGGHYTSAQAIEMATDAWYSEINDATQADMDNLTYGEYVFNRYENHN